MRPVDQTRFGAKDGNCFAASVASILECPLALVDFQPPGGADNATDSDWWAAMLNGLRGLGWVYLEFPAQGWTPPTGLHVIAGGPSPRGRYLHHAVVYVDGKLAHDPHPSRDGLLNLTDFGVLVPLAPAMWPS